MDKKNQMDKFVHAPITRHEALVPLSRDHYAGLVWAARLTKAAAKDRVARHKALAGFLDAWSIEISPHFDDEERLFQGRISHDDQHRLTQEHDKIRALAVEARQLRTEVDPSPQRVAHIGKTLNEHIRWEERELFGRIEESLDDEQLRTLATETAKVEATRARSTSKSGSAPQPPEDAAKKHGHD